MLALSLLAAACAKPSQPQPVSAANAAKASGADRQGHFARSPKEMSTCVTYAYHAAHPELRFILNVDRPETLTAMTDATEESKIWAIEFHDAGSNATDVMLRNVKATASDLDAVWRTVQTCAES